MTTTNVQSLAFRFNFNTKFLARITNDFEQADWLFRAGTEFKNTPHWILAHLTMARRYVVRVLGAELAPEPWEALFAPGTEVADPGTYPSVAELLAEFEAGGERVAQRLKQMTDDELAAATERTFPDGSQTRERAAGFMSFHESYHLGQLGVLRRLIGKAGFA